MKKKRKMSDDTVRVIKIDADALFEFIYESFIDGQEDFLDVDCLSVTDMFAIDWENGQFIFCAYNREDTKGNFLHLPEEVVLHNVMRNIPDTTNTMFQPGRYKEFTKQELVELSKDKKELSK